MRAGITSGFGVLRENDNGRRVIDFYAENGISVSNTYFEHKSLHKYTKLVRGQDGVEVKSMVDLVLGMKDILRYMNCVRAAREVGRGPSDHHVLLCKIRLVGTKTKRGEVMDRARSTYGNR